MKPEEKNHDRDKSKAGQVASLWTGVDDIRKMFKDCGIYQQKVAKVKQDVIYTEE